MKLANSFIALAAVIMLAGCSGIMGVNAVGKLNRQQSVGSPFTRYMASEYRDLSNTFQHYFFGHSDALYFANKGLASADGVIVMPETPNKWNLSDRDMVETTLARGSLMEVLDSGGRDMAPAEAAIAQARFDCWVVEQGKNKDADVVCKHQFVNALRLLKIAIAAPLTPSPPPVAAAAPAPAAAAEALPQPIVDTAKGDLASVQQAMFLLFFDWNKASLSADANGVLDAIAQELKSRGDVKKIIVTGHADTSGSEKYNQTLSLLRAKTVRDALITRGIAADKITAEGHGEKDLLIKTPDNVREPGNRRAQITLE
jgi:OOP family OmpA-OmpF porin